MSKRPILPLEIGGIRLRLLEQSDLSQTFAWRNNDHIRRWFFSSERLTPEQHASWFTAYQQRDDDFVFIIEQVDSGLRPIGQAAIYNINWLAGTAEFGRLMIGEAEAAGRGLARCATEALVAFSFERLGLREIFLEVIPSNVRAITVYEACGFEVAARAEKSVRMVRFATDWSAKVSPP